MQRTSSSLREIAHYNSNKNEICLCVCVCVIMLILFTFLAFGPCFTADRGYSVAHFIFLHHFGWWAQNVSPSFHVELLNVSLWSMIRAILFLFLFHDICTLYFPFAPFLSLDKCRDVDQLNERLICIRNYKIYPDSGGIYKFCYWKLQGWEWTLW